MVTRAKRKKVAKKKRRWGGIYEFEGYDHASLVHRDVFGNLRPRIKMVWLYVGQTRQKFEARWHEHEFGSKHWDSAPKPWFDLVAVKHKALQGPWWSDRKICAKELRRIWRRLTQYNVEHNTHNPRRIKAGKDWENWNAMRAERDALGGTAYLVKLAKQYEARGKWWHWRYWFREQTVGYIAIRGDEDAGTYEPVAAGGPALDGFTAIERLESRWDTEEARQ
jgi:hypothetical protein